MANDRAGALIDLLRENQLLDPPQLAEITQSPDARESDPELLAQCLIELGWVTLYQLDLVTQNKTKELRIGSYLVMDKVGIGGCGPAFKVRRPGKPGVFVLKQFPKDSLPADQLAMFNQDVRLAAQIQHPHIAPVASVGQLGNQFLYLRDFVDGSDLAQTVRDSGPLPVARACAVVRQAALALQHAHDKGLIHRRVKPANLVSARNGQAASVKVVDFGLANIKPRTKEDRGDRMGDLRGLGRTLCYLLTGRAPAPPDTTWMAPPGSGPLSTLRAGIPLEVQAIAGKMLAAGVSAEGYKSMAEAAAALEPHSREPAAPAPVANGTAPAAVPPKSSDSGPAPGGPPATEAISRWQGIDAGRMEVEPASVPFAVAAAPAAVVARPDDAVNVVAADVIPMAFAAPPSAMPIAMEPDGPGSPFVGTALPAAVEAVAVAVGAPAMPVDVSPAFALESAPAREPVGLQTAAPPVEEVIPMASAVVAAVPAAFALEPQVMDTTSSSTATAPATAAPPEPAPPEPVASAAPPPAVVAAPPPPPEPMVAHAPVAPPPPEPLALPVSETPRPPELTSAPAPSAAPPSPPPAPTLEGLKDATPPAPITTPDSIPMGSAIEAPPSPFTDAPASAFTDGPTSPFMDAPAGDGGFPMTRQAAPPRKPRKKLSKSTIMWIIVGALLHLIAAGILVAALMAMAGGNEEPAPKKRQPPPVTRARTSPAPLPMESTKPKAKTTAKDGDINPFDDIKD